MKYLFIILQNKLQAERSVFFRFCNADASWVQITVRNSFRRALQV